MKHLYSTFSCWLGINHSEDLTNFWSRDKASQLSFTIESQKDGRACRRTPEKDEDAISSQLNVGLSVWNGWAYSCLDGWGDLKTLRLVLRRSCEFTDFNAKMVLDSVLNSYVDHQPPFFCIRTNISAKWKHIYSWGKVNKSTSELSRWLIVSLLEKSHVFPI